MKPTQEMTQRKEWTWLMMIRVPECTMCFACISIGNKWDDNNWWQFWALNSDSTSTHNNSLDSKTIGQIVYDSSFFSQLVVNPARWPYNDYLKVSLTAGLQLWN